MTIATYPSPIRSHRRADVGVHAVGLFLISAAGYALIAHALDGSDGAIVFAVVIYVLCALASNLASWVYHFSPWHDRRVILRRIDHAAIYPSITGTFTPFFVLAGTAWSFTLLVVCWTLTIFAIWKKFTDGNVKSRWSTFSYIGLGAIGLCALPDLTDVPERVVWYILAGSACYVIGTAFYTRKSMPFRYAIWHAWVNMGAICMFVGIWTALP